MEAKARSLTDASGKPLAFSGHAAFSALTALALAGLAVFVFLFGNYGEELTAGLDDACAKVNLDAAKRLEALGNVDQAVMQYRRALSGRFRHVEQRYICGISLGDLLMREGRYAEAIEVYSSLPQGAYAKAGAYTGYVTALARNGNVEEAARLGVEWLAKANAENNREQILWANEALGLLRYQKHDLDGALAYFAAAATVNPSTKTNVDIARVLYEQGKSEDALSHLQNILDDKELQPIHGRAAALRKHILSREGDA